MNIFVKKEVFILVLGLGIFIAPQCWSQPTEVESLTNFLGYLDSLKKCVKEGDLSECNDAVEGKLQGAEKRSVEMIQEEIEEKCIDNISGGVAGAFNCYLSWVTGAYDTVTQRIMQVAEVRTNAMGNALYFACRSNIDGDTDKHKVERCFSGCDNNNFMSCNKAMNICLTTKDRGAMGGCVQKGIDISSNPHFDEFCNTRNMISQLTILYS